MFKKSGKSGGLCPVSFGLAVGLTCGLAMILWAGWLMYFGSLPMMTAYPFPAPGMKELLLGGFWGFIKGFVFGFFVALFYDWISCCGKKGCCRRDDDKCINADKDSSMR